MFGEHFWCNDRGWGIS